MRDRESYEFALASAAVALDLSGGTVRDARDRARRRRDRALAGARGGGGAQGPGARRGDTRSARPMPPSRMRRTHEHNAFKVELGKRTLVRALDQAAADGDLNMTTAAPEPKANMGKPVPRYDGPAEGDRRGALCVRRAGRAIRLTRSWSPAPSPRAGIEQLDLAEARAVPGVLDILTQDNTSELKQRQVRRQRRRLDVDRQARPGDRP